MEIIDIDIKLLIELFKPMWFKHESYIKFVTKQNIFISNFDNINYIICVIDGTSIKLEDYILVVKIKQRNNKLNIILND